MNKKELLQKSGAKKVIACFGKSTIGNQSNEYMFGIDVGRTLVNGNYAIVHGGYKGGLMEAVSVGAQKVIAKNNLSPYFDLGVAMSEFDKDWERTKNTFFLKTCNSLSQRVGTLMDVADAFVILPKGGFGTLLEFVYALHENELCGYMNKKTKPIYVMDKKWVRLLKNSFTELDVSSDVVSIEYVADASTLLHNLNVYFN